MKAAGIKIKKIGFNCKGWAKNHAVRSVRRAGKAASKES